MNAQFQSLFENVCRCFGHTPTNLQSRGGGEGALPTSATSNTRYNDFNDNNNNNTDQQPMITKVNSQASSVSGKRRTNRLELNDEQYDELFDKAKKQQQQSSSTSSSHRQPPRSEGVHYSNKSRTISSDGNGDGNNNDASMSSSTDHETAQAVAQAKLAANPPRYRTKRKRSAQTREEIFRNKNRQQQDANGKLSSAAVGCPGGKSSRSKNNSTSNNGKGSSSFTPQTDFSRLLNPSLALCFATPVRGTEEFENDEQTIDNSDTATLNTNGEDTITSTLYFDSKYAHIQETQPPMPLFNQFKLGQAKDEIRTIMATDSHSSVRMIKIMQQNEEKQVQQDTQQRNQKQQISVEQSVRNGESSTNQEDQKQQGRRGGKTNSSNKEWGRSSSQNRVSVNNINQRNATSVTVTASLSSSMLRKKDTISTGNGNIHIKHHGIDSPDEEMEDAVPDVKPVSSSTDSSRLSNTAARHGSS